MDKEASFLEACQQVANAIKNIDTNSPIYLFSHFDADGLTAASILLTTFYQLGYSFHLRILERLEYEELTTLCKALPHGSTIFFTDIGTGVINAFSQWDQSLTIFILDHHSPSSEVDLAQNVYLLNPHLFSINGTMEISGAGVAYLVSINVEESNKRLAPLAIIGALGDRQDQGENSSLIGLNKLIVEHAKNMRILSDDVAVWFFDRSRPISSIMKRTRLPNLENDLDVKVFLQKLEIPLLRENEERTFYDLNEDECRLLASELVVSYNADPQEIYKHDYHIINEEIPFLKDARVFATKLNACGRLQRPDVGVSLCLGDRQAALRDLKIIEKDYSYTISQGLKWALSEDNLKELSSLYLLDGRKSINDRFIGTITSMISSMNDLNHKPILGCALISPGKLKISMRVPRSYKIEIDASKLLKQAIGKIEPNAEVGGHAPAAGAIISEPHLFELVTYIDQLVSEGL